MNIKPVSSYYPTFEALRMNNFEVQFKTKHIEEEKLNLLTLAVSYITVPKIPFYKDSESNIIIGNFEIGFTDFIQPNTIELIKEIIKFEDLEMSIQIFTPLGELIYKPIHLTDIVFNNIQLGRLANESGDPRNIVVEFTAGFNRNEYGIRVDGM